MEIYCDMINHKNADHSSIRGGGVKERSWGAAGSIVISDAFTWLASLVRLLPGESCEGGGRSFCPSLPCDPGLSLDQFLCAFDVETGGVASCLVPVGRASWYHQAEARTQVWLSSGLCLSRAPSGSSP